MVRRPVCEKDWRTVKGFTGSPTRMVIQNSWGSAASLRGSEGQMHGSEGGCTEVHHS